MPHYDGPSIFRKSDSKFSKVENQPKKNDTKKNQRFENTHKNELPKNVRTRNELQDEARRHMATSPTQLNEKSKGMPTRFKNKYIPPSMQQNKYQEEQIRKKELYTEIQKRLFIDPDSYLLFDEYLSPSVKEEIKKETQEQQQKNRKIKAEKSSKNNKTKRNQNHRPLNTRKNLKNKEKIKKIEEKILPNKTKPTSGLQRSFSKIMEEDQEVLKNSEKQLNSLFSERN